MVSGSPLVQDGRGQADRGAGVLGLAFQHQVDVLDLGELAAHRGAVRLPVTTSMRVPGEGMQAVIGGAQQRAAGTGEVVEELGGCCTRQWPEPGPHPARRNYRNEAVQR